MDYPVNLFALLELRNLKGNTWGVRVARINVEDSLWSDSRFMKLCLALGNEFMAAGVMLVAWKLAQKHWCPDRKPIPKQAFEQAELPEALLRVGLATVTEDGGVKMRGVEKHFEWWFERQESGRRGGLASAMSRKAKLGTAQPKKKNDAEIPKQSFEKPEAPLKVASNDLEANEPSSSSSFSNTTKLLRNLEGGAPKQSFEETLPGIPPAAQRANAAASPVGVLIGIYIKAWQARYGTKARPDVGGKTQGILKSLIKHRDPSQIGDLLQVYCQMKDRWFETKRHDLATFNANLNKIALAAANGHELSYNVDDIFTEKESDDGPRELYGAAKETV